MMGAQMDDWDGSKIVKMPADDLDRGLSLITPFLSMMGGGKSLREAPPIISESMIFPYLRGMVFCAKLTNDGGWKAVDEAYATRRSRPSRSSTPRNTAAKPDLPTIDRPGRAEARRAGWKELGRNVLGELQTSVMLGRQGAKAAAGWDGDRYAVFEGPDQKLGLVWLSTWDSEDEAREFAQAYARYQTKRHGQGCVPAREDPRLALAVPGRCLPGRRAAGGRRGRRRGLCRRPRPPPCSKSAFHARKTEFRRTIQRARTQTRGASEPPADVFVRHSLVFGNRSDETICAAVCSSSCWSTVLWHGSV